MTALNLNNLIHQIQPLDSEAMQAAQERQNQLTKPPGSLGRLEELSVQMAGISGLVGPNIQDKVVIVMAGDHGVVKEGVSAYPQEVTAQMVYNILGGGAAINVLARHVNTRLVVADLGVAVDLIHHPALIVQKVGYGTGNISREPAMTRAQAQACLEKGAQICLGEIERGMDILATGEMGIGNTTPSAAIASSIIGIPPEEIVGRGTGVDDSGLERKIGAIRRALQIHSIEQQNGLDVLTKIGGFEIGGLAGAILAASAKRRAVVIDGYISTAAAMIASLLAPDVRNYLIAAHNSMEGGHKIMLDWLGIKPLLDLKMRLGEGSGAVLAIPLVEASCKILCEMATFDEAGISAKVDR